MDQNSPSPQTPIFVSQPGQQANTQSAQKPNGNPEGADSRKKHTLIWLIAGIGVLLIGIGVGVFIIHPHENVELQNSQAVNQNPSPEATNSAPQVSPGTNVSYPTIAMNALPLGDNKYTTTGPKKGYVYLCRDMKGNGGAQETGSWISGSTWTTQGKPAVQGSVIWPNATFSDKISGNNRVLVGNGLPVSMTTGAFPIASTDPAYKYDKNPNSIKMQTLNLSLPVAPTVSLIPNCMGGEVGVMTNGVPLFNGFDEELRDAAAHEVQDSCDGHPQVSGEYHYHSLSRCFKDIKASTVLGFALDGFPITGPVQTNGKYLTTAALDECHGTTSTIMLDGKSVSTYHYVMTEDFPYSASCFKGKPVNQQVIANNNLGGQGQQASGLISGMGRPPLQAGQQQMPPVANKNQQ